MKARPLLWLTLCCCACGDGSLGSVVAGVRVEGAPVDFGKALEGTTVTRTVVLVGTGRASVAMALATRGPFTAPTEALVPGGGRVELSIDFHAGSTSAEGALLLSAQGETLEVALHGRGVRPALCVASKVCRVSVFDLALEACVESLAQDGAACTPDSLCLENGLCQAGLCLGTARTCDDANLCTDDSCAEGFGCAHTAAVCPQGPNPCLAPVCDPQAGCGEAPVLDGVPCGTVDCVTANLCVTGQCAQVPTPDGFLCASATPCQGEGHCQAQSCVRPDAGVLFFSNAAALPQGPEGGRLLSSDGNLFFESCELGADAGCALRSMTPTGFLRFEAAHADARPRQVVSVSKGQVLVLAEGALEAFSSSDGAFLWSLPFGELSFDGGLLGRSAVDRIASRPDGGSYATVSWATALDDAGFEPSGLEQLLWVDEDGGVLGSWLLGDAGTRSLVALDEEGALGLYSAAGPLLLGEFDGGELQLASYGDLPGEACFAGANESWVAGARHVLQTDAGVTELLFLDDAGQDSPLLPWALLAQGRGYAFYRPCLDAGPGCADEERSTVLRAYELRDGGTTWEATVLPGGVGGRLEEAALVLGGAVVTLTELSPDAGGEAHVQVFAGGRRLLVCPLPPGQALGGAVFDRGFLHAAVSRDGGWRLESYDLKSLPLETGGWPQRDGLSGQRRAR